MTNRYHAGWSAGQAAAVGITEIATGEDGAVDYEFLQGYAAGLDQVVNGDRYAQVEQQRIEDDLNKMAAEEGDGPPIEVTPEYMERRLDQEFNRRIQAERVQRLYGGGR